ncbi:MAG: hypothetical protein HYY24_12465 [Verrucomicrobia bacterium]|nr:hypothetical protein [Verrucomicrobiota bacterium]
MSDSQSEPRSETSAARLHGWDDEKVYFWSPQTGERCVSDEPELVQQLIGLCAEYFRQTPGKSGK